MINITELPQDLSAFDLAQIEELRKDLSASSTVYNAMGMEVIISSYDPKEDTYQGHCATFSLFDGMTEEQVCFKFEEANYLPESNNVFDGFIEEMVVIELNKDTYQLMNEYSGQFITYSVNKPHSFSVSVNDKKLEFDSFKLAAKYAFESARKSHDYLPPCSRERINALKEHMKTDEFQQELDQMVSNSRSESEKNNNFLENEFSDWIINAPKLMKDSNITCITSDDYAYNESIVTSVMSASVFESMMNAAFLKGTAFTDETIIFKNENIIHGNLHFQKLYGQGIALSISLVN